jgi:hypothetical protein
VRLATAGHATNDESVEADSASMARNESLDASVEIVTEPPQGIWLSQTLLIVLVLGLPLITVLAIGVGALLVMVWGTD